MMQDDHEQHRSSSSGTTTPMNRDYYIQYYTQKLQAMAIERQNQALSQVEQLFQHQPHLVSELIHSEMVQAFLNPVHQSSLMIAPSIKCLKTLIVILTTVHILIQQVSSAPSEEQQQLLNQEQALLQYFISSGCRNNMEMYQWLKGIQQSMMNMLGLANHSEQEQQHYQQQALYWYKALERYFDLVLFPELKEEYINNYVRPSTTSTSNQTDEKKAFVFLLFEFVDAIHTILKVRK